MSDAGDWDLDLRPARRAAPRHPQSPDNASQQQLTDGAASLDIAAALADLRRSLDRIGLRLSDIERVLSIASEDGAAEDWMAAVQRVRTDLARPRPVALSNERRARSRGNKEKPVERASGD